MLNTKSVGFKAQTNGSAGMVTGARINSFGVAVLAVGAAAFAFNAGCEHERASAEVGPNALSGSLTVDGSNTVFPIVQQMGEDFGKNNPGVTVAVNTSGTGSGFQKFERGEIDIAAASRPISASEDAELKSKGVAYIEIPIAYDGVSVIVNPQNTWTDKLTTAELRRAWNSHSTVKLWSDIRPSFPREKISFYGPTENHGTFEYFTEAIDGKIGDIRMDCQKSQEYNSIVQGVSADKGAIAYVGFNYYDQNKDKVKAVPIDAGSGAIVPSQQTVKDGSYTPLSRPLFLYVAKNAYDSRKEVRALVNFALSPEGSQAITDSSYVLLPAQVHNAISSNVRHESTGTRFGGVQPGANLATIYSKIEGK